MAIHKFSLIADIEYDDENGEYEPLAKGILSRQIGLYLNSLDRRLGTKTVNYEVAEGDLHTAFGIGEKS